jgi:plasmid stabilization system protein ParE
VRDRLPVRITPGAAAQIREAAAWWHQNRPSAPGAIHEELERAFNLLALQPHLGARARNTRLRGLRRIHLSRVRYHLYYRVATDAVEVVAFWHSNRGAGPPL